MKKIDWSKAPEGATHFTFQDETWLRGFWKRDGERVWFWADMPESGWAPTYADPIKKGVAIQRPIYIVWSGEGLPPVGSDCEVNDERVGLWAKVDEVLAHSRIAGKDVAVFQIGDYIAYSPADRFRPLRTPEQIAEEARDREVDEMITLIGDVGDNPSWPDIAATLHEAGYRKQVQP